MIRTIRPDSVYLRITKFALLAVAICFVSATVFSQSAAPANEDISAVKIKNFGRMDERFYRGGQPREGDYQALKALGITTVIDLCDDPAPYEKTDVEALGMKYVNIPMSDTKYPTMAEVDEFMKLVQNPSTGKFFVHCAGGRHRTGVMGAVYRFNQYGWNFDQVYSEMKAYDFYTRWGHGEMKKFVEDYWATVGRKHVATLVNQ
jgi:protein tyrosine/serine phosphatase